MENNTAETRKGFFQNDRALVCSMLVFYGVCIVGLIAVTFWWLNASQQRISSDATATQAVLSTQQAHATSTAIARSTELAQYDFVERFDAPSNRWINGSENNPYWIGSFDTEDGVYIWDIERVKMGFIYWVDYYKSDHFKDFDVYVDTKFIEGSMGDLCSGLIFRKSPEGWTSGGYSFLICNNSGFSIAYHGEDGWDSISGWRFSDTIRVDDWNRIEVSARGEDFAFTINHVEVYETTDGRQGRGSVGIAVEMNEKKPAIVYFDNFGFQSR